MSKNIPKNLKNRLPKSSIGIRSSRKLLWSNLNEFLTMAHHGRVVVENHGSLLMVIFCFETDVVYKHLISRVKQVEQAMADNLDRYKIGFFKYLAELELNSKIGIQTSRRNPIRLLGFSMIMSNYSTVQHLAKVCKLQNHNS